jgi:hypothetical protein
MIPSLARPICFIISIVWLGGYIHPLAAQTTGSVRQDSIRYHFPRDYTGTWQGELSVYNALGKAMKVPMWIEIQPIDTSTQGRYTFGLVYGSKAQDWRPYEIMPVDTTKGIWRVDEKNSIQMESYAIGPKLLCWFVVEGTRILTTYERTANNTMWFEVVAGRESAISTTGNSQQGDETIPEVKTYPITGFQRALLRRVD